MTKLFRQIKLLKRLKITYAHMNTRTEKGLDEWVLLPTWLSLLLFGKEYFLHTGYSLNSIYLSVQ